MCRSRRELIPTSIYYLLTKFGFDTAENEPCKVCPLSAYRSPRCSSTIKTSLVLKRSYGIYRKSGKALRAAVRSRRHATTHVLWLRTCLHTIPPVWYAQLGYHTIPCGMLPSWLRGLCRCFTLSAFFIIKSGRNYSDSEMREHTDLVEL